MPKEKNISITTYTLINLSLKFSKVKVIESTAYERPAIQIPQTFPTRWVSNYMFNLI